MNAFYKISFVNFVYLWQTLKNYNHKSLVVANAIMIFVTGSLLIIAVTLILKILYFLLFIIIWAFWVHKVFSNELYRDYYKMKLSKRYYPSKWLWIIIINAVALLLVVGIARTISIF